MITYFETSALVKVLLEEPGSDAAVVLWDHASSTATSVATHPEARSALARKAREGGLTGRALAVTTRELRSLTERMHMIPLSRPLALTAGDLAERHALRAYDAVHLASARAIESDEVILATWDAALARAARDIGLAVAGALG